MIGHDIREAHTKYNNIDYIKKKWIAHFMFDLMLGVPLEVEPNNTIGQETTLRF